MYAKNYAIIFGSFPDIQENAEWPRLIWPTLYSQFGDTELHMDQHPYISHDKYTVYNVSHRTVVPQIPKTSISYRQNT